MDMLRDFNELTAEDVMLERKYSREGKEYMSPSHVITYFKEPIEIGLNTLHGAMMTIGSMVKRQGMPESTRLPLASELYFLQKKDRKPNFYSINSVNHDYTLQEAQSLIDVDKKGLIKAGEEINLTMTLLLTPKGWEGGRYDEKIFEKTGRKKYLRVVYQGGEKSIDEILVPEGGYKSVVMEWNEFFGIPSETEEKEISDGYNPIFLFDPIKDKVAIGYSVLEVRNRNLHDYVISLGERMTNELYSDLISKHGPIYYNIYSINALNSIERNVFGNSSKAVIQPMFSDLPLVKEKSSENIEHSVGLEVVSASSATEDKLQELFKNQQRKEALHKGLILKD